MKIEKAIEYITHHAFISDEVKEMAIEALEKQIPKKPNKAIDSTWGVKKEVNVCPVCDYYLTEVNFIDCDDMKECKKVTFCETCGQRIDWKVEE